MSRAATVLAVVDFLEMAIDECVCVFDCVYVYIYIYIHVLYISFIHCMTLNYVILHSIHYTYITLHCIALYYITLYSLYYTTVQYSAYMSGTSRQCVS